MVQDVEYSYVHVLERQEGKEHAFALDSIIASYTMYYSI